MKSYAIDWVRRQVENGPLPSAVFGWATSDGVQQIEAFGNTDGRAATIDDYFALFSVTKPLVGLATARALERGLLSLTAPLTEALPEFGRDRRDVVRLGHLLSHRAGIQDAPLGAGQSLREQLVTAPQAFTAGTRMQYSNIAFEGTAAMLEHATGRDVYAHVDELNAFTSGGAVSGAAAGGRSGAGGGAGAGSGAGAGGAAGAGARRRRTGAAGAAAGSGAVGVDAAGVDAAAESVSGAGTPGITFDLEANPHTVFGGERAGISVPELLAAKHPAAGAFATAGALLGLGSEVLRVSHGADSELLHPSTLDGMRVPRTLGVPDQLPVDERKEFGLTWHLRDTSPGLLERRAFGHSGWSGTQWWVYPELDATFVLLTNLLDSDLDGVKQDELNNAFVGSLDAGAARPVRAARPPRPARHG